MPVSNSLGDTIILRDGLIRHHKDTYVVDKGILGMVYEIIAHSNS